MERGKTARAALDAITNLLEEFGQGGGCAADDPSWTYHNSFLIADAKEAWVLETAGKWWIAEKVVDDVRNISNGLSIRTKYDLTAEGLVDYAINKGYWSASKPFDFAKAFAWGHISDEPSPFSREGQGRTLLKMTKGKISPKTMMQILLDHDAGICMHGGFRSTASMVSHIEAKRESTIHWFTGTPNPCQSFFKPLVMSQPLQIPKQFTATLERNPQTLWWAHELATRQSAKIVVEALSKLEKKFLNIADELIRYPERTTQHEVLFQAAFEEEWQLYQEILGDKGVT